MSRRYFYPTFRYSRYARQRWRSSNISKQWTGPCNFAVPEDHHALEMMLHMYEESMLRTGRSSCCPGWRVRARGEGPEMPPRPTGVPPTMQKHLFSCVAQEATQDVNARVEAKAIRASREPHRSCLGRPAQSGQWTDRQQAKTTCVSLVLESHCC